MANAPLRSGTAGDIGVIWGGEKEEYFLMMNLTGKTLICPTTGKSADEGARDGGLRRVKAV
jgi:hypothetical protein